MDRTKVTSSNIVSVGLEEDTLEVEFSSGGVYQYAGESAKRHYDALLRGGSPGRYFHSFVRNDESLTVRKVTA